MKKMSAATILFLYNSKKWESNVFFLCIKSKFSLVLHKDLLVWDLFSRSNFLASLAAGAHDTSICVCTLILKAKLE